MNAAPASSPLDTAISAVEQGLRELGVALVSGDAPQAEHLSTCLRQDMLALAEQVAAAKTAGSEMSKATQARLDGVAQQLMLQRENLVRRAVPVDQMVRAMFPERQPDTYGPGLNRPR